MLGNEPDITIVRFPDTPQNIHSNGWAQIIGLAQGKTNWLYCIDADQAIVPVKTDNVQEILEDYKDFAAVKSNWSSFGSSGHLTKTPGSLYERFTMRAKLNEGLNNHGQFCCQPDRTLALKTDDPHHPKLANNEFLVNTNKQLSPGPFNKPPLHDIMYVAHYINKSREEAETKWRKGRCDIFGEKMPHNMFDIHEEFCNAEKEERVLELWNRAKAKFNLK